MSWLRRPYGYERVGGTVVTVGDRKVFRGGEVIIVESEAKELRDAATKLLAGATLGSCVRDLEDRGVPTVHGKPWTVTALRRALVNPRTAGMAHYHGAVVGAGAWPPIFTQDLHARLIAHLTDPALCTTPPQRHQVPAQAVWRVGWPGPVPDVRLTDWAAFARGGGCPGRVHPPHGPLAPLGGRGGRGRRCGPPAGARRRCATRQRR